MPQLSISLLGAFEVAVDSQLVTRFEYDKVRALLAYLAVESHHAHRRESLAALLWPENAKNSAHQNLSQALFKLRRAIGDHDAIPPYLTITAQTIQTNHAADWWLDTAAFVSLLEQCEQHRHRRTADCEACMQRLRQAAGLYRGNFLEGFSINDSPDFEEWALLQRERFQRFASEGLALLAGCHEARGEIKEALAGARRRLELDPWQEEAHRQVMRLLASDDQRNAALVQYESCRRLLDEELGVEPSRSTVLLYEHIRDGSDLYPTSPTSPHNLPASLSALIGRADECAALYDQLSDPDCRLLTLFGAGGVGKTRLSLEVARRLLDRFAHGVYLVRLAYLPDANAILPAIAQALGFTFHGDAAPQQQLQDYLRRKQILLVLDNFDRFADSAGLIVDLLRAAPELTVLVTSRASLGVQAERLYLLKGLAYPQQEPGHGEEAGQARAEIRRCGAVELFEFGARRIQPDFEPSARELAPIAEICRLVGGLPLAILLAASWMNVLTAAEIVEHICGEPSGASDRGLGFLQTDWKDLPPRLRTMRAVFDRSWNLLSQAEQRIFASLAVFRGGFTGSAVQTISGAALQQLKSLVDRSLLQHSASGRYELHELVRQFAAEKLAEQPAAAQEMHKQHSAYYALSLFNWGQELRGLRQQPALAELTADLENARAVWSYAAEHARFDLLGQALDGLCQFLEWRGNYRDGEALCKKAAHQLADRADEQGCCAYARLLTWHAHFCRVLGQTARAAELLDRSLKLLPDPDDKTEAVQATKAFLFHELGHVESNTDPLASRKQWQRSLALHREIGDDWATAQVLNSLGNLAFSFGDYAEARRLLEESLSVRRVLGDAKGIANVQRDLAMVLGNLGHADEAEYLLHKSIARCREIRDRPGATNSLYELAVMLMYQGRFAEARPLLEETADIHESLGMRAAYALSTEILGWNLMNQGLYTEVQQKLEQAKSTFEEIHEQNGIALTRMAMGGLQMVHGRYAEAYALLTQAAAIMGKIAQRDEASITQAHLAQTALMLGLSQDAVRHARSAVCIAAASGAMGPALSAVIAVAALHVERGDVAHALELYALAERYPYVANSRWRADTLGNRISELADTLPSGVVAAARARGQALDLPATLLRLCAEFDSRWPPNAGA